MSALLQCIEKAGLVAIELELAMFTHGHGSTNEQKISIAALKAMAAQDCLLSSIYQD
jgi:hypothetical protein